jgi:hypothetical protein
MRHIFLTSVLAILAIIPAGAQNHVRKAMKRAEQQMERKAAEYRAREHDGPAAGYLMVKVVDGDTLYFDTIEPTWVFAHPRQGNAKQWRKYYRLVYNFPRVYVYAQAAARMSEIADSTIAAENMGKARRQRYIDGLQKQITRDFEGVLRKMSYSQGTLLIRLIDREVHRSSYNIIKDYKGGMAAGFWQGVAKVFNGDLKTSYDPDGIDRETEELIQMWNEGTFDALYYSIFLTEPPHPTVPEMYR